MLAFLALLGAPYIYEISSLRVNTYLFPTAKMISRTRLSVMLYMHCMP